MLLSCLGKLFVDLVVRAFLDRLLHDEIALAGHGDFQGVVVDQHDFVVLAVILHFGLVKVHAHQLRHGVELELGALGLNGRAEGLAVVLALGALLEGRVDHGSALDVAHLDEKGPFLVIELAVALEELVEGVFRRS